jgi:D-Tyr-tRNAtyr deacylase
MSTVLAPKIGDSKLHEMLSSSTPIETKGWAARWYAEMLVELFLSDEAKLRVDSFDELSLGNKIKEISCDTSKEIIDALYTIESIGNQATHFKLDRNLDHSKIDIAVGKALGLFDFILIDLFKDGGLVKTPNTARLLSTLLPSIRVNVLQSLVNLDSIDNEYDAGVFHKYLLALTKNGQREKARRLLKKLKKKNVLNEDQYQWWERSVNAIHGDLANLPIAKKIEDCKRNFSNVLSTMSKSDKEANSKFIKIINTMLDKVDASDMEELVGDKILLI